MSFSVDDAFFTPLRREWDPKFLKERRIDLSIENRSFVNQWIHDKSVSERENTDIIDCFLADADEDQEETIQEFCQLIRTTKSLGAAPASNSSTSPEEKRIAAALASQRVAFVIDGDRHGRMRYGGDGLTALDLHQTLSQPRFSPIQVRTKKLRSLYELGAEVETSFPLTEAANNAADAESVKAGPFSVAPAGAESTPPSVEMGTKMPSQGTRDPALEVIAPSEADDFVPEQRYVYIRDLSPLSVCALAATTPLWQVRVLHSLIHHHLNFESAIGVETSNDGFRFFSMEFHLPFYTFATSATKLRDRRNLRAVDDISFLSTSSHARTMADYLCPTQISCSVSGFDEFVWTSYLFVDRYHEMDVDERMEKFDEYDGDPFICDKNLLENRDCTPRERFVTMLRENVHMVRIRWDEVLKRVALPVENYLDTLETNHALSGPYSVGSGGLPSPNEVWLQAHVDERQRYLTRDDRIVQSAKLIRKLSTCLESTIDNWKIFMSQDVGYFRHQGSTPGDTLKERRMDDLIIIQKEFTRLQKRLKRFRATLARLDKSRQQLRTFIQHLDELEMHYKGQLQSIEKRGEDRNARFDQQNESHAVRRLGWIACLMSSVQVAGAILTSLGAGNVLPSSGPGPLILLTFGVTIIVLILEILLGGGDQYRKLVAWLTKLVRRTSEHPHEESV